MAVNAILNNTLLVPDFDGQGSEELKTLEEIKFVENFGKYANDSSIGSLYKKNFLVSIESDNSTKEMTYCQQVGGLKIEREVETQVNGGDLEYSVKLPGRMKYGDVTFTHLYTNSDIFLKWMINGSSMGTAVPVNISVTVGDRMVYTLEEAVPVSWTMGNLNEEDFFIKDGQVPVETLVVACGRISYARTDS